MDEETISTVYVDMKNRGATGGKSGAKKAPHRLRSCLPAKQGETIEHT